MSVQHGQMYREASQKSRSNLLAQSDIVALCKENVGIVGAEQHLNMPKADNLPNVPNF
jgi:hypothetical protein